MSRIRRAIAALRRVQPWAAAVLAMAIALLVMTAIQFSVLAAAGLLVWMLFLDVAFRRPELIRPGVFVLAILAFFVGFVAVGDATARTEFYAATAQIIPVLFIALAIQMRGVVSDRTKPADLRRAPITTAIGLVLAEYESLRALACGAEDVSFGLVVGGLAAAGVGLVLPVLLGDDDPTPDSDARP